MSTDDRRMRVPGEPVPFTQAQQEHPKQDAPRVVWTGNVWRGLRIIYIGNGLRSYIGNGLRSYARFVVQRNTVTAAGEHVWTDMGANVSAVTLSHIFEELFAQPAGRQ